MAWLWVAAGGSAVGNGRDRDSIYLSRALTHTMPPRTPSHPGSHPDTPELDITFCAHFSGMVLGWSSSARRAAPGRFPPPHPNPLTPALCIPSLRYHIVVEGPPPATWITSWWESRSLGFRPDNRCSLSDDVYVYVQFVAFLLKFGFLLLRSIAGSCSAVPRFLVLPSLTGNKYIGCREAARAPHFIGSC